MRWVRYEANGHPVYGIVEGDTVTEVRGDPFAGYEKTTPAGHCLRSSCWCRSSRAPSTAPGSITPIMSSRRRKEARSGAQFAHCR